MKTLRLALLVTFSLSLSGCDKVEEYVQKKIDEAVTAKLTDQVKGLNNQITDLGTQVASLKSDLAGLKGELNFFITLLDDVHSAAAFVSTDGHAYGVAQTEHGAFLVNATAATPYLDGYKVHLLIGNMSTAQFNGAKITVNWGLQYGDKGKTPQEVAASQQKKVFDVTTTFNPGAWTGTDVFLSPAKPEEVKAISVTLSFNDTSLRKALK